MDVSRRDFLRIAVPTGTGTALSSRIGSRVNLGRRSRAQELHLKRAKITLVVFPYCYASLPRYADRRSRGSERFGHILIPNRQCSSRGPPCG
jgi:hypothetical protein